TNFSVQNNLKLDSIVNDPGYLNNKQFNVGSYRYIGFQVDVTGDYVIAGTLQSRDQPFTPGPNGQYRYSGLGGGATVLRNNAPNPNTTLYAYSLGNQENPAPNTVLGSFNTVQNFEAGVSYQLEFNSYMYHGFGGTGTLEHNSGWNVTIAPVPEPTLLGLVVGLIGTGIVARRRRASLRK
ncbi:MAG: PEP-CTERM sorting domain-containing protein, partial [Gemmataceae bacterium]